MDMVCSAWNYQTVSDSGMENAVWRAVKDMEMNSCICRWNYDRKMSRFMTAGEAKSVTAHEVINSTYIEVFFPNHNVRYIAVNDGVDSIDNTQMDITPFRNIINEMYAKDTSRKIKTALRTRKLQGVQFSQRTRNSRKRN